MCKTKIFITEDEFIISKNLEIKLTQLGYDVIGKAASGEGTLEKIKEIRPDLILMDIMLAGKLDGIDTANIIKKEYDIPLIFLTAYSIEEMYKRAEISEPYAYIIKPFEERELEITISIALYKHQAEKKLKLRQEKLEILNENLDKLVQERTSELLLKNLKLNEEIIERRKSEEYRKRLSEVIEQAEDHILITNIKGEVEYINPKMESFIGYVKDEICGKTPRELNSGRQPDDFYKKMWQTILKGNTFRGEFINKKKNGDIYIADNTIVPLFDSENNITHFASIGRDITKERENEKQTQSLIEIEKERISKDLHDGIGQTLTAIKFSIGSLVKSSSPEHIKVLKEIKRLIEESTQEVRNVSFNLMPSVLHDYGLEAAINKLVDYLSRNASFKVKISYDNKLKKIKKDSVIGIYRIIQEALNNAQKHAKCSQVNIKVEERNKNINISIIDDGVGFDFSDGDSGKVRKGQGIHNMSNRTKLIDGNFSIKSILNKGTSVEVVIPRKI